MFTPQKSVIHSDGYLPLMLVMLLQHVRSSGRFVPSASDHLGTEDKCGDYEDQYHSREDGKGHEDASDVCEVSLLFRVDFDDTGFLLDLYDEFSDQIRLVRIDFAKRYLESLFLSLRVDRSL